MKKRIAVMFLLGTLGCAGFNCEKKSDGTNAPADSSFINTAHLDHLYTAVTFPGGGTAAGIYIYSEAPDYHVVEATGEGYTCVDDVARAALVYLRSDKFPTDTATQAKAYNLIRFIVEMQSPNGYFYNFLFSNGLINKFGTTSINNPEWWSWRALQALAEAGPLIKNKDAVLYNRIDLAIANLVSKIKTDLVNLPLTTHVTQGIMIPEWLPAGSGTDQAALLVLGLIPYATANNDIVVKNYIKKLADGIVMMQKGAAGQYPYSCILSWENTWHAYGSDQAFALLKAGAFLQDATYTNAGLAETDNFLPWLLLNGYLSSFEMKANGSAYQVLSQNSYEQIAYGIRPMVFAAAEAYSITGQDRYADIAGHLAAWFLGANETNSNIYDKSTGRCFDAIATGGNINRNSGAESTIEALLTFQKVESNTAIKAALYKYKK
jgi:hypothetical protein